jgi:hypothetical protein
MNHSQAHQSSKEGFRNEKWTAGSRVVVRYYKSIIIQFTAQFRDFVRRTEEAIVRLRITVNYRRDGDSTFMAVCSVK